MNPPKKWPFHWPHGCNICQHSASGLPSATTWYLPCVVKTLLQHIGYNTYKYNCGYSICHKAASDYHLPQHGISHVQSYHYYNTLVITSINECNSGYFICHKVAKQPIHNKAITSASVAYHLPQTIIKHWQNICHNSSHNICLQPQWSYGIPMQNSNQHITPQC